MEDKIKAKMVLMVILLGLIFGVNQVFKDTLVFLIPFDTLALATIIAILFDIRKQTGYTGTPEVRRKIFAMLIMFVFATTIVINQYLPKPGIYVADILAIAMIITMYYRGYVVEDREASHVQ